MAPSPQSLRISPADLKKRLEMGERTTLLDVRSQQAWDTSGEKVRGSVREDAHNFQIDPRWPADQLTVAYCT